MMHHILGKLSHQGVRLQVAYYSHHAVFANRFFVKLVGEYIVW